MTPRGLAVVVDLAAYLLGLPTEYDRLRRRSAAGYTRHAAGTDDIETRRYTAGGVVVTTGAGSRLEPWPIREPVPVLAKEAA